MKSSSQITGQVTAQVTAKVIHQFRATPEVVFEAWITQDKIRQWFAPGMGDMVRVLVDPKEGGIFSFVQRRGLDNVEHNGKYFEFNRPNRLGFTWQVKDAGQSSRVTIDIVATAAGSELTLVHELHPHWADYTEKTQASWSKMLNAMAAAIE